MVPMGAKLNQKEPTPMAPIASMVPTGQKKGSNTNGNKTIQSRIEKVTRPNDKLNIHKQRNIFERTNLKCK